AHTAAGAGRRRPWPAVARPVHRRGALRRRPVRAPNRPPAPAFGARGRARLRRLRSGPPPVPAAALAAIERHGSMTPRELADHEKEEALRAGGGVPRGEGALRAGRGRVVRGGG